MTTPNAPTSRPAITTSRDLLTAARHRWRVRQLTGAAGPRPRGALLLVSERRPVRARLSDALRRERWAVVGGSGANEALATPSWSSFDGIVAHGWAPDGETARLIAAVRRESAIPVSVLVAAATETECAQALDAGADAFMCAPMSIAEVSARLGALARRWQPALPETLLAEEALTLDLDQCDAAWEGQSLALTPAEWVVLAELLQAAPDSASRRDLLDLLGADAPPASQGMLRTTIWRLRKKLAALPAAFSIERVADGYAFTRSAAGQGASPTFAARMTGSPVA